MAARRLIVVMLVLLGLSTLVAALVPAPSRPPSESGPAPRPGKAKKKGGAGEGALASGLVNARITVSTASPQKVRVKPGQHLVLLVGGSAGADISIPAFGLTETMTPSAPARFDLIVDRRGRFPIRAFGVPEVVGTIVSTG